MKINKLLLTTFLLGLCQTTMAHNHHQENNLELSIFFGGRTSDTFENDQEKSSQNISEEIEIPNDIDIDNDTAYGLVLAWDIDPRRQGEVLLSHSEANFDESLILNDSGISVTYFHLGGNVIIAEGTLPIFLSGGLGITYMEPDESRFDSEIKPSANLGLGLKLPINEGFTFRMDARGYLTYIDGESELFCSGGNCSFYNQSELWLQGEITAGLTYRF